MSESALFLWFFLHHNHIAPLITFCATLCLYNLDGLIDGRCAGPQKKYHQFITFTSGCLTLFLGASHSVEVFCVLFFGMLLCGLYATPLGFATEGRAPPQGLKSIVGLKAPFVGFCVGTAVVVVPYITEFRQIVGTASEQSFRPFEFLKFLSEMPNEFIVMIVILGILCTQNALLCDVPDEIEDRQRGTPTLLVSFGKKMPIIVGTILCLASGLLAFLMLKNSLARLGCISLAATLLLLQPLLMTRHLTRRLTTFAVDGALLLPCMLNIE